MLDKPHILFAGGRWHVKRGLGHHAHGRNYLRAYLFINQLNDLIIYGESPARHVTVRARHAR